MATKLLNENKPYKNHYHFIASTKYRKNAFMEEHMRKRLKEIIEYVVFTMEDTTLIETTVAFNHIHVLLQSSLPVAKISQRLYGATARLMRKEFPELLELSKDSLWGGKSCEPVKDENHLNNCISYIRRHRPDNTKV